MQTHLLARKVCDQPASFAIFFVANSATNLHLSELFTLADDSLHVLRMRSSRPFELGLIPFGEAGVRIVHP